MRLTVLVISDYDPVLNYERGRRDLICIRVSWAQHRFGKTEVLGHARNTLGSLVPHSLPRNF